MSAEEEIPKQTTGAQTNIEHSVTAGTKTSAHEIFAKACKKLLNVNDWHRVGGKASAEFELISDNKKNVGFAKVGDYFKIDIPGPGNKSGEGYDWVKVGKIEDKTNPDADQESLIMQVRPSKNPEENDNDIAHFLSSQATSTFIIKREGNKITASVHGRNELPNTSTETFVDKIRNAVIGSTAAMGASKIQWKLLVKGLLDGEPDN